MVKEAIERLKHIRTSQHSPRKLVSLINVKLAISYLLRITLILAVVGAVWKHQWLTAFLTVLILGLTFLPSLIAKNYRFMIPSSLELSINIFIYAALFLGEIHSYYYKFWWWDIALHTGSGIIMGFIGFLLVYILNQEPKVKLRIGAGLMAIFAFTFAVTLGVFWEIFEFYMDMFFGLVMQRGSLIDTMWDLIVDMIGAAAIALVGYVYIKRGREDYIFNRIILTFIKQNFWWFDKKRKGRNSKKRLNKKKN